MSEEPPRVVVVGAGLVGSLLACYLGRRGCRVDVYEGRPDPRTAAAERGRSINLALSERGLQALRQIGLADTVLAPALPMHGRRMHGLDGSETFQSYSARGDRAINSIGRATLNRTLIEAAAQTPGVTLHFGHRATDFDPSTRVLTVEHDGQTEEVSGDVVLAADGSGSVVRRSLQRAARVQVVEDPLDFGYKELTIPPTSGGEFALDPDALHIWPRGAAMMIALPNPDRSFTCTLFWPRTGPIGFDALAGPDDVERHFTETYPDAVPLMPTLVADYLANPVGTLGTVHTDPWQVDGSVALIGDAAHAILPFFGQGANCGFEDVVELDRCLDETSGDWSLALPMYQERRRPNSEAIARLAKDNFVEMRDRVGSRAFLLSRQLEHGLERVVPGYRSRYELVSFTTTPYSEVEPRVRRQRVLVGLAAAGALLAVAAMASAVRARGGGRGSK